MALLLCASDAFECVSKSNSNKKDIAFLADVLASVVPKPPLRVRKLLPSVLFSDKIE